MGVYIKGMEMPKEGSWKTIRIYPDGTCAVPNWQGDCTLIKGTKAVPVPPQMYSRKPITNADRIRSMTDEELATVIALPYLASPPWCAEHTTCPYISEDPTPCDKCALEWLKKEANDAT